MPTYKFKKAGHFMGKYFDKDATVELHPKQAKYALLSNQLEGPLDEGHAQTKAATPAKARPVMDTTGERFGRRTVGGTTGVTKG